MAIPYKLLLPIIAFATCILITGTAFATDSVTHTINIVDTVDLVLGLIFAAVAAVVSYGVGSVLAVFKSKTGIEIDDSTRAYLNQAILAGLAWAEGKVREELGAKYQTIETKSEIAAKTAQYVLDMVPDAVAHFGLTEEKLLHLIESRLEDKKAQSS